MIKSVKCSTWGMGPRQQDQELKRSTGGQDSRIKNVERNKGRPITHDQERGTQQGGAKTAGPRS